MAEFRVIFSRNAEKDFEALNQKFKERFLELATVLKTSPVPATQYDVIKLVSSQANYRIRIGHYRMQYKVFWEISEIQVHSIEWRKESTYK